MKRLRLSLVAVLAVGVLLGCSRNSNTDSSTARQQTTPTRSQTQASPQSSNATGGHDHAAETAVARIGIMEAQAAVNRGEAVILDVRAPAAYSAGRIKGAVLMPEAEIAARASTLPKDKKIITYCT